MLFRLACLTVVLAGFAVAVLLAWTVLRITIGTVLWKMGWRPEP